MHNTTSVAAGAPQTRLEQITRDNYPKTEAVVFGLPAATAAATIQFGSNSVAVKPQFKEWAALCSSGQHCALVQADGGQDKELQRRLRSAGQDLY